jgi:hypothetical protein
VKIARHVVVAVPRWPAATTLRPIVVTPEGKFAEIAPASEVPGMLARPLASDSGKLVAITDQGKATTFESAVDPADGLKLLGTKDSPAEPAAASPNVSIVGIIPGASAATVTALAANGAASEVKLAELTGFVARQLAGPAKDDPPEVAIASVLALAGGNALLIPAGQPAELQYLAAGASAATSVPLPGPLAALPIAWKDGIAVACTSGTIAWLDTATGALKADPLQINLPPGQRLTMCRLVAGGKDDGELFVAHSGGALLRVGLANDPEPQLVDLGTAKLELPIRGLVASDEAVGVLDRGGGWHKFSLPDLAPAPAATLAGRSFATAPVRIGSVLMVATDSDELVAFSDQLALAWKTPLARGPLAGTPVMAGSGALVATKSGWLARMALDSGIEEAAVNLDQPLAAGPLIAGQFAAVIASDGTLLTVPLADLEAKP